MDLDYLAPYRDLRGFNYVPSTAFNDIAFWRDYDESLVERELSLAQRLDLNSARIFLSYAVYEREPDVFLGRVRHFVRAAHQRGISVMPVLWDSCFDESEPTYEAAENKWYPNPGVLRLTPDFWPAGEVYCRDLVECLASEPGLLMWDVMNEPRVTSWIAEDAPDREERTRTIWRFVHHFCRVMKGLDPEHPITVGVHIAEDFAEVGGYVDVLAFHDYRPNRAAIRAHIDQALGFASELGKPVLLSEIGCLARANPYDVTLEVCRSVGIGWYLWELMIGVSRWRTVHGVCYPDGTVRDPSIVAAIDGFFRKRQGEVVAPDVDREGAATRVSNEAHAWLGDGGAGFAEGMQILERMANCLEAGELVPMSELPSAAVLRLSEGGARDRAELCRLLVHWNEALTPHLRARSGEPGDANLVP